MSQLMPYLKMDEKVLYEFLDAAFRLVPDYIREFQHMLVCCYKSQTP